MMAGSNNGSDGSLEISKISDSEAVEEWCDARPTVIPSPTVWPMALALAGTISLWGILTSWVFVVVGLALSVLSLIQWIGEMRE